MFDAVMRLRSALSSFFRSRHFIAGCLIASLAVRLFWVFLVTPIPISDFDWYYQRGVDIAEGRGYSIGGKPTAFWPIGYPIFLGSLFSLFGPSVLVARLADVMLYAGVLYLSYLAARTIFASELCGRATLAILAFYPNHIAYTSLLSAEILFLFLLLLGITLLLAAKRRMRFVFASGLAFGLAGLIKPHVILLPTILLLYQLPTSMRSREIWHYVRLLAVINAGLALAIAPWVMRNYSVFGAFVLSNNAGLNLLYGNNPYATGTYQDFEGKLEPIVDYEMDERLRDVKARSYAIRYIIEHPGRTIGLWPRKLFYLFNEDGEGFMWNQKGIGDPGEATRSMFALLIRLDQIYYVLILGTSLASVLLLLDLRRKGKGVFPGIPLLIVAYFTATYLLTFAHSRFHFPLVPFMVMHSAALLGVAKVLLSPIRDMRARNRRGTSSGR